MEVCIIKWKINEVLTFNVVRLIMSEFKNTGLLYEFDLCQMIKTKGDMGNRFKHIR